jgi:phytoene dehydrogenase-like protein
MTTELRLDEYGLKFSARSLPTHALSMDGAVLRLTSTELRGACAADAAAYPRFMTRMNRYAAALLPFWHMIPPRLVFDTWTQKFEFAKLALRVRRMGREDMRELMRIIGMNIYDLLDETFESDAVKGAIAVDAILGAEWGPRAPGTVLTWLYRLSGLASSEGAGVAQPAGGMASVAQAFAASATAAGAQLRLSTPVKRVLVENDRAVGVELANGETIRARQVISNADPKTTFFKLLGVANLDTGFVRRLNNVRQLGRAGKLHLALRELPKFSGLGADALGDRLVIGPSMDYLERAFNPSKYREYPTEPMLEISLPSVRDNSLSPSARHVLSAVVQFLPYDDSDSREASKAACLDSIMVMLERYAPGIGALVEHAELVTPFDLEQQFGMSGGHWHHAAMGFDQFFFTRPLPGAAQHRTPVEGLYLCGAGCHPGGGVMGIAGRNAARQVLEGAR